MSQKINDQIDLKTCKLMPTRDTSSKSRKGHN